MKRRIDGMIGQDILKKHIVKIDFIKKIIDIFNDEYKYRGNGYALRITNRGPAIHAMAILKNGKLVEGDFIIDTGSNSSLILNSLYADTINIQDKIGNYKIYNSYDMCGNMQSEFEGKAFNLFIGNSQTKRIPTTLTATKTGVLADKKYAGLIGTPVLRCFTMIIDLPNGMIYLEPNETLKDFSKNTKH